MPEIHRIGLDEVARHFQELEDPRSPVNRRHPLVSVVVLALMAVLAAGCGGGATTTPVTAQSPSKKTALVQFQITVRSASSTAIALLDLG